MPVYIDDYNAKLGRMKMCHMIADTHDELIYMINKLGLDKKWIQYEGTPKEHFDICLSKKQKALEYGAKEVSIRELSRILNAKK